MALAAAVAAIAVVYLLLRSRHGLALTAIRDGEVASASQGIDAANGDGVGKSLPELTSG
jgi:branched-chain amino acid transport system permease protein